MKNLTVITGKQGTGKSYLLRHLSYTFKVNDFNYHLLEDLETCKILPSNVAIDCVTTQDQLDRIIALSKENPSVEFFVATQMDIKSSDSYRKIEIS